MQRVGLDRRGLRRQREPPTEMAAPERTALGYSRTNSARSTAPRPAFLAAVLDEHREPAAAVLNAWRTTAAASALSLTFSRCCSPCPPSGPTRVTVGRVVGAWVVVVSRGSEALALARVVHPDVASVPE